MQIERMIREYINQHVLFGDETIQYGDDTSFLSVGILDSMAVLELVSWIEKAFGFTPAVRDITPENFDSVERLAAFIRSARPEPSAARMEPVAGGRVPIRPALAPQT